MQLCAVILLLSLILPRADSDTYLRCHVVPDMMGNMALPGGLLQRLQALASHPPATHAEVERAEAVLGLPLHEPVRDLYLLVGNGGFGPGFFDEGVWVEDGRPLAAWLEDWPANPDMPQPVPRTGG